MGFVENLIIFQTVQKL